MKKKRLVDSITETEMVTMANTTLTAVYVVILPNRGMGEISDNPRQHGIAPGSRQDPLQQAGYYGLCLGNTGGEFSLESLGGVPSSLHHGIRGWRMGD